MKAATKDENRKSDSQQRSSLMAKTMSHVKRALGLDSDEFESKTQRERILEIDNGLLQKSTNHNGSWKRKGRNSWRFVEPSHDGSIAQYDFSRPPDRDDDAARQSYIIKGPETHAIGMSMQRSPSMETSPGSKAQLAPLHHSTQLAPLQAKLTTAGSQGLTLDPRIDRARMVSSSNYGDMFAKIRERKQEEAAAIMQAAVQVADGTPPEQRARKFSGRASYKL